MPQVIELATKDRVLITADHYLSAEPNGFTLLLLHMMSTDRKSWKNFARQANQAGFHCLAPDLRGHGHSTTLLSPSTPKTLNYQNFSNTQHRASYYDIQACIDFLNQQNTPLSHLVLIGASIGANLALWYTQEHPDIPASVLISPGLNYRGIKTESLAQKLSPSQSTLLITGAQDSYPTQTAKRLQTALNGERKLIILPEGDHGTNLFTSHPKLPSRILSWISRTLAI